MSKLNSGNSFKFCYIYNCKNFGMPSKKHWSNLKIYSIIIIQIGNEILDSVSPYYE